MGNATPGAIKRAAEHGLDIDAIAGSGAEGNVTVKDVNKAIREGAGSPPSSSTNGAGEPPAEAPTETPAVGEPREGESKEIAAIRAALPDRAHAIDCPAERLEAYEARKPVRSPEGAVIDYRQVRVLHCIDCGGTVVIDDAE